MQITIEIDDAALTAIAQQAARETFAQPRYGERSGAGYIAICGYVTRAAGHLDYSAIIADVLPRIAREEMEKAARAELAKRATKAVKEQSAAALAALLGEAH